MLRRIPTKEEATLKLDDAISNLKAEKIVLRLDDKEYEIATYTRYDRALYQTIHCQNLIGNICECIDIIIYRMFLQIS